MAASSLLQNSKFHELCRLCATKTELMLSMHIFEGDGPIRQLSKKIDNCLQIQVHQQDELPKIICENCLYKLEMFWDFKDKSFRTEQILVELYKQFKDTVHETSQSPQEQCVVSIDSNGLIVQIPHHQILTDSLQDVPNIDISQLGHRENAENYAIILHSHHDLNAAHPLENLELNNHDLPGQDLSNQSIHSGQENLSVMPTHNDQRFNEVNLSLMQQQLLNDSQFRIHQDFKFINHLSMAGPNNIYTDNMKHMSQGQENDYSKDEDTLDYSNSKNIVVDSNLSDNSLGVEVDTHLNRIISYSSDSQIDHLHQQDESDSNTNILADQEVSNVLDSDAIDHHHQDLDNLPADFYSCNICGKSYANRAAWEVHCQSHLFKYGLVQEQDIEVTRKIEENCRVSSSNEDNSKSNDADNVLEENADEVYLDRVKSWPNEDSNSLDVPYVPELPENDMPKIKKIGKVCEQCGKCYSTNYKLSQHMKKHTGERPFKCKSCEKAFRSKIGLAQHEAKHTGQYDFSCPTCGKGFQCKSYLMVHQRVHSDLKPYPCTTCGQNFKTKQSLLDHTNRHLGVKPYLCGICGRGFITKALCRAHEKTHTGVDNRKYSCKICQKRFVSKSYLQTHSRIHTGEKPFMCEVCGKGFLTRVDLKIHLTMHTGEKSYVCEMCGKAFARRDALKCHRRSHTGERPYGCDVCGKTFTQFTPMANHRRHHTGERPYPCETCGKTFVTRSTMLSHAKKHLKKTENGFKEEIELIEHKMEQPA
ncbi:zinc finger protein 260-like [Sitophilus oryzae]|uniref:Zinc finger protein 260-like n=1 Tax=Sitophilus oryzae TaxID=7048 RepID=A0A6J2YS01_SITOR|nr:zinc finger protein 260-like [Sitophilus oryzae]XP_030766060.1 zinc finger protein 260-like [Sitophilus oryzae]